MLRPVKPYCALARLYGNIEDANTSELEDAIYDCLDVIWERMSDSEQAEAKAMLESQATDTE